MTEDIVLREFMTSLDRRNIPYEVWIERNGLPYPLSELAEALGISEEMIAKVVLLKVKDSFMKVVLPVHWLIDMERMKEALRTRQVRLATTVELKSIFPGCEPETIPPFDKGDEFPTYIDLALLEEEEIAFAVGNRRQIVKMNTRDFAGRVCPCLADFHLRPLRMASGI